MKGSTDPFIVQYFFTNHAENPGSGKYENDETRFTNNTLKILFKF